MTTKPRRAKSVKPRLNDADRRPGKILDIFRKDLGLSQMTVGEILDCSYQQVAKYLNGTNRLSPSHILTCAARFTVSPATFFREAENPYEVEDLLNRAELEFQLLEIQETLTIEEINRLIDVAKVVFDLNYRPEKK